MTALAIISLSIGAALGLRFSVLILVPVTIAGLVAVVFTSAILGTRSWMAMALITAGLEVGYLGLTAIWLIVMPSRHLQSVVKPKTLTDPAF
jgi:hypothetical protein